ncbi:MAG: hypothetical protein M5U09_25235 [Gammaproteobacteria bacterium]|nr:hypothetical protein [Gammaproteobacteria bacterium]
MIDELQAIGPEFVSQPEPRLSQVLARRELRVPVEHRHHTAETAAVTAAERGLVERSAAAEG